ncbi:MAG: hypothetical protein ACP5JO_04175 [Candidatus Ratteibacteria bacterium]
MKKLILVVFVFAYVFIGWAEQIDINFEYPDIEGDFYLAGTVFFPPSSVMSVNNILVLDAGTKNEIASKITVQEKWPDDSIMSVEIIFPANSQKKTNYAIHYGSDIKRRKTFSEPAVLPTISFFPAGAGRPVENVDISVGQINVRVDKSTSIRYWWYIAPMGIFCFSLFTEASEP